MRHQTCLMSAWTVLIASSFGCVQNTPPPANTPTTEQIASAIGKDEMQTARVESEDLGIAVEKAASSLQLYERALRSHAPSQKSAVYLHLLANDTARSQAETTALLYLSDQRKDRFLSVNLSSMGPPRRHNFSAKIEEVCDLSKVFRERLKIGVGSQAVASVCPKEPTRDLQLKPNQAAAILREGLRSRTATQRKHLLLLATFDSAEAMAPLISLPTLNLGTPIKEFFGLDGLDIALIAASTQASNRARLLQLFTNNLLTERERSRVLFALVWHNDPKAQTVADELFDKKSQPLKRTNAALSALAARISNRQTLQKILEKTYEWSKSHQPFSDVLTPEIIGADFWGKLITRTLVHNINHAVSWTDLKNESIRSHVNIKRIFEAALKSSKVDYMVRHTLRSELSLKSGECELFHTQLDKTEPGHAHDALIKLLARNNCITQQELEVQMTRGSAAATLLLGQRSTDHNAFFLNRLKAKDLKTVWTTSKGLLTDEPTIRKLTPPIAFAEQLSLRLSPKKQNFYVLRLLKSLVNMMPNEERKKLSKSFMNNLTPYANGRIGSIHPDALIVFELINTPEATSIIANTLRNLKPGQVQIKLMNRFGHILK